MSKVIDFMAKSKIGSRPRESAEPVIPQRTIDILMDALDRNRVRAIIEDGLDPATVFEHCGPFSPNASTTLRLWPERYFR